MVLVICFDQLVSTCSEYAVILDVPIWLCFCDVLLSVSCSKTSSKATEDLAIQSDCAESVGAGRPSVQVGYLLGSTPTQDVSGKWRFICDGFQRYPLLKKCDTPGGHCWMLLVGLVISPKVSPGIFPFFGMRWIGSLAHPSPRAVASCPLDEIIAGGVECPKDWGKFVYKTVSLSNLQSWISLATWQWGFELHWG